MADPVKRDTLLPPIATPRERAIGGANAGVSDVDGDLVRRAGSPDISEVPAEYLPARAEMRSVDVWDPLWPEEIKRAVIEAAPEVHRLKGTVRAVKAALAALRIDAEIIEWWQETPRGAPYTFTVNALARARLYDGPVLDARLIAVAFASVMRAKPESRAFDLTIGAAASGILALAPAAAVRPRVPAVALARVPGTSARSDLGLAPAAVARPRVPVAALALTPVPPTRGVIGLAPSAVARVRVALTANAV